MRKPLLLVVFAILIFSFSALAQTSWKGTYSSAWSKAGNWTAGVPTSLVDVIIGDAAFTGPYSPTVSSSATCKSLTIGGSKAATLTVNRALAVTGDLTLNANGTLKHGKASLTLKGNWSNAGTYTVNSNNARVIFAGTAQTLGGSVQTSFRKLTINAGATVTLTNSTIVTGSQNQLVINGTLNPNESPATYTLTGNPAVTVSATGTLKVNAATFNGNYTFGSFTLAAGSTVDYSATAVDQTISNYTYSTLKISGAKVKSLAGSLNNLNSSSATAGNLLVASGTLNLGSNGANRGGTVEGGTLAVENGATLKIGGNNSLPANYKTISLGAASTVEYNGGTQTVSAQTYGHLTLSAASGTPTKTLPATAFSVIGTLGATNVTFTAASNITIGSLNLGVGATFNGGSFSHSMQGNWVNNGTFTGQASTIVFGAAGSSLSGTGANNFHNLQISAAGTTASATTPLSVSNSLTSTGGGSFTHASGGTFTLSGTSKTLTGTGFSFHNLTVSGTWSTAHSFAVTGNLAVSTGASLTCSAGELILSGTAKTITGPGTMAFATLSVPGSITTAANFSTVSLSVPGSLTATAGTATFTGSGVLAGTANLNHVTLNGTSLQLAAESVLGIAGTFTKTAGSLNVTSTVPNTVQYNGTTAQSVLGGTYHHLSLSNASVKTPAGALTLNGNLAINTSATFNASSYTHVLFGNWTNNGTFTAGTGTIEFQGHQDNHISGTNTFNNLTVNISSGSHHVELLNDATAATVNMLNGYLNTGSRTLTLTNTRTGNGSILGTIKRSHTFAPNTSYAFESPANTITFSAANAVSAITVTSSPAPVGDFPYGASLNRAYTVSVAGTFPAASATLRLHYEDEELNGNTETGLQLWKNTGSGWAASGKSGNSTATNYVEQSGLSDLSSRWSLSGDLSVVQWNGSASSNWFDAANWTVPQGALPRVPGATDIASLGEITFTSQPAINGSASVKNIYFGSARAVTLSLASGGSLATQGNISGAWSANTRHSLQVGNQSLTVGGNLVLSDGTTGRAIDLDLGAGSIHLSGSLVQSGGANITITGGGQLNIGGDFTSSGGTFTAGTGTVTYNGTGLQAVAGLTYNHLTINKSGGVAVMDHVTNVSGNLLVAAGMLDQNKGIHVTGNLTIAAGATLDAQAADESTIRGNWYNNGTFAAYETTFRFTGTANQTVSASTFHHLVVDKASGTLTLGGNVLVQGSLSLKGGTVDLASYTLNRNATGGTFTMADGTSLLVSGSNNFPQNFLAYALAANSSVTYNGSGAQTVAGVAYGHLTLTGGGTNAKSLSGQLTVNGNLTLNSGATFSPGTYSIYLYGNWEDKGTYVPGTSVVLVYGTGKTITGNTTFYRLIINGSYTVVNSEITLNNMCRVAPGGTFNLGNSNAIFKGDFTNSGTLLSNGTATFTGHITQTIQLLNSQVSTSTGVVTFNGTVPPVLISNSTPTFATINFNNTGGVTASVGWNIMVAMNVASGSAFHGGPFTHNFYGSLTNNGTVTSSGNLNFIPSTAQTLALGSNFNSTGILTLGGTGALTVTGTPTLNDVMVANAGGVTTASGWTVGNDLSISHGGIFHAGSYTHTVGGDLESDGTLNGGTSTFRLTAPDGLLSGSPGTTFYHLEILGTTITANNDFNVSGNLKTDGTLDLSTGIVAFTGSGPSVISGTTSPLAQLAVEKTGSGTTTLARNLTVVSMIEVASGTLDAGAYTITQDASAEAENQLAIGKDGTLRLGGSNSLPPFTAYDFDSLSTVEYAGANQTIPSSAAIGPYGNLTLSTAGTKTAAGPLNIRHNFTLSAGTFVAGSYIDTVGGNWKMTGGTFTNTGNTVVFNGEGGQDISSTGAFNNVVLNKVTAALATLSGNVTIQGALTLTAGRIDIGAHDLTLSPSGAITGAAADRYVIATGAGSLVQQVTNGGSRVFPVGTASDYLPATIAFNGSSVTDNMKVRVVNAVYKEGESGTAVGSAAVNNTWFISEGVVGGSNATITLQWPASLELPGFSHLSPHLAHYTNGAWDLGTTTLMPSGSGPFTLTRAGFTNFSPFAVMVQGSLLPVKLTSFTATYSNGAARLQWQTATEENSSHFSVERSTDGVHFVEVGRVGAQGNSAVTHSYAFTDAGAAAAGSNRLYYRLNEVDVDGAQQYSKVISLNLYQAEAGLEVRPNPVSDMLQVYLGSVRLSAPAVLTVTDLSGQVLMRQTIASATQPVKLNVSGLSKGMYWVTLQSGGTRLTQKIIKQ
ncbi:T9SS type A sorting domain-containing protein [Paraflavisolibacter sp. H34]|uniref:T9SS type A sorting domain-containing protein n=1 Tax=Huijunlia imazamoxiresistens TaxID=3127457 RepID=UPI003016D30E